MMKQSLGVIACLATVAMATYPDYNDANKYAYSDKWFSYASGDWLAFDIGGDADIDV